MSRDDGVSGVVRAAVGAAAEAIAADQAEPAQLDLLPTRYVGEKAEEQRNRVQRSMGAGGRPPGAQNLATRQFRDYMLRLYGHPLEWLARWSLHTPETLAEELGCTRLEAFDRLKALKSELAPYFASRLQPTDDKGQAVPSFALVIGGQNVNVGAGAVAPWMLDPEVAAALAGGGGESEQNQGLSGEARDVSHAGSRTDAPSD